MIAFRRRCHQSSRPKSATLFVRQGRGGAPRRYSRTTNSPVSIPAARRLIANGSRLSQPDHRDPSFDSPPGSPDSPKEKPQENHPAQHPDPYPYPRRPRHPRFRRRRPGRLVRPLQRSRHLRQRLLQPVRHRRFADRRPPGQRSRHLRQRLRRQPGERPGCLRPAPRYRRPGPEGCRIPAGFRRRPQHPLRPPDASAPEAAREAASVFMGKRIRMGLCSGAIFKLSIHLCGYIGIR